MSRFPNLFLIGAPRSGTTFLYAQLSQSADIFCPSNKEPFFFLRKNMTHMVHGPQRKKFSLHPEEREEQAYLNLYNAWGNELYAIDASTYYLSAPEDLAQSIIQRSPEARVIAVLREPVSRAFSHYLMEKRDGWTKEPFDEALQHEEEELKHPEIPWGGHYWLARGSRYLEGLTQFYKCFGQERMRVYLFDDVVNNPESVLSDISSFLSIEPLKKLEASTAKNGYAVNRFPLLSQLLNLYRACPLRAVVNKMTPRLLRDFLRTKFDKVRLNKEEKPTITEQEKQTLKEHLGDDYEKSLAFVREKGLLFEGGA